MIIITKDENFSKYPDIKAEDIQACIQYAIDIIASEDIHITTEAA